MATANIEGGAGLLHDDHFRQTSLLPIQSGIVYAIYEEAMVVDRFSTEGNRTTILKSA